MINSAGAVVASRSYAAYGATTGATGTLTQPFGYTGVYTDSPTGLIKLGARYYDPTLGRFTQTDLVVQASDPNLANPYPYTGNDPVNGTDPSGAVRIESKFFNLYNIAYFDQTETASIALGGTPVAALVGYVPLIGTLLALEVDYLAFVAKIAQGPWWMPKGQSDRNRNNIEAYSGGRVEV